MNTFWSCIRWHLTIRGEMAAPQILARSSAGNLEKIENVRGPATDSEAVVEVDPGLWISAWTMSDSLRRVISNMAFIYSMGYLCSDGVLLTGMKELGAR